MQVNDLRRPDVAGHALGWSLPGHLKGLRKSSAKPLLTCTDARQGGLAVAPGTSLGHATPRVRSLTTVFTRGQVIQPQASAKRPRLRAPRPKTPKRYVRPEQRGLRTPAAGIRRRVRSTVLVTPTSFFTGPEGSRTILTAKAKKVPCRGRLPAIREHRGGHRYRLPPAPRPESGWDRARRKPGPRCRGGTSP